MSIIKEKYENYRKKFKNIMAAPKIEKVVVSTSFGSKKDDKTKIEAMEKSLMSITGQKPKLNRAKKSIATFKLRKSMPIGYTVTLRGKRMYDFLDKLINITIPRVRDFRGLDKKIIDAKGNITIPFKEHIVFPEAAGEDIRSSFGLGVTVVTTAKTKEECLEFLMSLGFPFKK